MLNVVKLYHWNTTSYSHHHATDELYDRMNEKTDRFVEIYIGKDGQRGWNQHMQVMYGNIFSRDDISSQVHTFREFLMHLDRCLDPKRDSDLLNIRDDLLGDVNQILFLYTLR